ncbi:methyl-accepting chemotaxis protein [Hydrogenophaga sp. OTU3427]|uniref:methyl-accepting chemotaxis protein n=1 Tax=Hydrogenophaga sp. OTU3427 TaxID=3043856 RepID=UPI00313E0C8B
MRLLPSLRIGARLALAFGAVLLLLLAVAAAAVLGIQALASSGETLYRQRTVPLVRLADVNALLMRNRVLVMDMLIDPGTANIERRSKELRDNNGKVRLAWNGYRESADVAQASALMDAFEPVFLAYMDQGLGPAAQAASEGRYDDTVALYSETISPMAPKVAELMGRLTAHEVAMAQREFQQVEHVASRTRGLMWAGALLAVVLGVWLAWAISRSVTRPLRHAVSVANAIAAGDLRQSIPVSGRDECGDLLRALQAMSGQLHHVVSQVLEVSRSVAAGAAEMSGGTADLSARTERQAAALEETSAAMEELTTLAEQGANAAVRTSELATTASGAAREGGAVVGQVVTTMNRISDSSRRIGDIIGVIDGIAFQTNILALNAAVEAARAGEQGRGFAVVAGEVRALAQRSAQAAREIQALVGGSIEQVAEGARLVQDAGDRVTGIVEQVDQIRELIEGVTGASRHQNAAVLQIAEHITVLDQNTQSNAALAEQSSAAAESLRRQADRLIDAMAQFQVGQHDVPTHVPRLGVRAAKTTVPRLAAA